MIDPTTGQEVPGAGQTPENRLAELEKFFEGISPVLVKLNASPDLVQAMLADKINDETAKAALEGKLSIEKAEKVAAAAVDAVAADLGAKAFNAASSDEVSRLVEEKISALRSEWKEHEDMSTFETYTNQFISETPDFAKYSGAISEWLDEHDVTDVRVAYYAVKGELSEKAAKERSDADAVENAKNVMLTAGGGNIPSNAIVGGQPLIDSLIANRANPNRF